MQREEIEILRDIRTEKVSNRKASEFVLRTGFNARSIWKTSSACFWRVYFYSVPRCFCWSCWATT